MPFGGLLTMGLLGAGTSLFGGLMGSNAASQASQEQQQALQQVIALEQGATQEGQSDIAGAIPGIGQAVQSGQSAAGASLLQQLANLEPYMSTGDTATQGLQAGLAPGGAFSTPQTFTAPTAAQAAAMPGEQFEQQQGELALNNSAAAMGGALSGGALKAGENYAEGLASTNYNQMYNEALEGFGANQSALTNSYNRLATAAGMGQGAASTANSDLGQYANLYSGLGMQGAGETLGAQEGIAGLGMQGAQIAGQAEAGIGNAQAAGTMGQANAWSSALSGLANAGMGTVNSINSYNNMQQLMGILGNGGNNMGSYGSSFTYNSPYGASPFNGAQVYY